jgi:hypothetical protein
MLPAYKGTKRGRESPLTEPHNQTKSTKTTNKTTKTHPHTSPLPMTSAAAAAQLLQVGYVVVPLSRVDVTTERDALKNTMRSSPEFVTTIPDTYSYQTPKGKLKTAPMQYVGGDFGALGHSTCHHPDVRKLEQWSMAECLPVFREVLQQYIPDRDKRQPYGLEKVKDRLMFRPMGATPTREAWHRDESPSAEPDDMIFGGWLNLDNTPQFFSCVPGTHRILCGDHAELKQSHGFFTIPKTQHAALEAQKQRIEIPSGHMLIFFENLVHEVVADKAKHDMYRLFLGWRLTKSHEALHTNHLTLARLRDQAVMPLKSNQMPPLYPKLWWVNAPRRLQAWSRALFRPELLVSTTRKSAQGEETLVAVPRFMGSLRELGLPLHRAYTQAEESMYVPNQEWTLLEPGREKVRGRHELHESDVHE